MLEEVQIQVLVMFCLFSKRHEEADKEYNDYEKKECNCILERTQDPLTYGLLAMFCSVLIVLLIVKVREGDNEQTKDSIE